MFSIQHSLAIQFHIDVISSKYFGGGLCGRKEMIIVVVPQRQLKRFRQASILAHQIASEMRDVLSSGKIAPATVLRQFITSEFCEFVDTR
jgi:hypothetical protein